MLGEIRSIVRGMSTIPFDNTYSQLPARFFSEEVPESVSAPEFIRLNTDLVDQLGLDADWLGSTESGLAVLAGNAIAEGATPIAQAYAGHQFGGFVPQLGDGRAILLGEVVDRSGHRYDLQLKGSGRTAFSRRGDGKSALGPVLREYIVSEAMAALGVPTTRALAAVASGESVLRQEGPCPGGVFTRVASSHIRVGTFQYFYAREDTEAIRILADYVIERHYSECLQAEAPYRSLLERVIEAQCDLVTHWMSLGFIHGVMNTDNCAISGETIDYGPCAFVDTFHPEKVFSSIDTGGRYAWGNQGQIVLWNLCRFAETLLTLLDDETEKAVEIAQETLKPFEEMFAERFDARFRAKLGLSDSGSASELIGDTLDLLTDQEVDFTLFFRHLTQVAAGHQAEALQAHFSDRERFESWLGRWQQESCPDSRVDMMQAANPILIPRNHRIEEAIQAVYQHGDYAPFHRLVDALAKPFEERAEYADLEQAPQPEEVVCETFCGT